MFYISRNEPALVHTHPYEQHMRYLDFARLTDGSMVATYKIDRISYYQLLSADGTPRGAPVEVARDVNGAFQDSLEVEALAGGGFVLAWNSPTENVVNAQRYRADGTARGDAVTFGWRDEHSPDASTFELAALADGGWVITGSVSSSRTDGLYAKRFTSSGATAAPVARVGDDLWDYETVGLSGGGFVLFGRTSYDDPTTRFRFVDASGTAGDTILIEGSSKTQVGALSAGRLLVAWTTRNETVAQIYSDAGKPLGAVFTVSAGQALGIRGVVELDNGDFAILIDNASSALSVVSFAADGTRLDESVVPDALGHASNAAIVAARGGGYTILGDNAGRLLSQRFEASWSVAEKGSEAADILGADSDAAVRLDGLGGDDVLSGAGGNDMILGGAGNDRLAGGDGGDWLHGGSGNDMIEAGAGNDELRGGGGADRLSGGDGDDLLDGETGADTLTGGAGDELYIVDHTGDRIVEAAGEGIDLVRSSVSFTLSAGVENLELTATNRWGATDIIIGNGNDLDNVISGDAGANELNGGGGNDILTDRDGANRLIGGSGDDFLRGGEEDDVLDGGEGFDRVAYRDETRWGGVTVDLNVQGRSQNVDPSGYTSWGLDTLIGIEHVSGTRYADVLTGDEGANWLWGSMATRSGDELVSELNDDVLDGRGGDDLLTLGIGGHRIDGGAGNDTLEFTENGYREHSLTVSLARAGEVQETGNGHWIISGIENLVGGAAPDMLSGDAGANLLAGSAESDTLIGGAGDDRLIGDGVIFAKGSADMRYDALTLAEGAGNDRLDGGLGADRMEGGEGDDLYVVDNAGDVVVEDSDAGHDAVEASVSYRLGTGVEALTLTGEAAIDGAGNAAANLLTGNSAANRLDGAAGGDRMAGGLGDDTYVVDDLGDMAIELAGGGIDSVESAIDWTLGVDLEKLVLTGAALSGHGNALANTLTGNDAANLLDGGAGADVMAGGGGDDRYIVDDGLDLVLEAAGEGTDSVDASVSYALAAGSAVETLRLIGTAFRGTGNELANTIVGNAAANRIGGGGGADQLLGGLGNDRYVVDHSGDKVVELNNEGIDLVEASVSFSLSGQYIEKLSLTGIAAIDGTGNGLANLITGNGQANRIDGGGGADDMAGRKGDDVYVVDNVADKVVELDGEGSDIVMTSVSYSLAGQFTEVLNLTGLAAINGTGNGLDNRIVGNAAANALNGGAGNDRLDGGSGADTMVGGLGNDVFVIDNVADKVTEKVGEGTDTVEASISYSLAGQYIEMLKLTGSGDLAATGNNQVNSLFGNGGGNLLNGMGGADILAGGAGNDRYVVDDAADKVVELAGEGMDGVEASVSFSLAGQYAETLTLTGTAATNGTGNGLANALTGNEAANRLSGGAGDDVLSGRGGSDSLSGGSGANIFAFDTGLGPNNVDQILDFIAADDTIRLDRSVFGALMEGALNASVFVAGTAAKDADDRIVFNKATGDLWYDADGSGAGAAVLFANFGAGETLTATDFVIVA